MNKAKSTSSVLLTDEYTTEKVIENSKFGYDYFKLILFKLFRKINGICLQLRFTIPKWKTFTDY